MKGTVFNIQGFSIHDGPGIRTAVFLKGCPLHCLWCHNPESHARRPELFYDAAKCIACGRCAVACPTGAHSFEGGVHSLAREKCTACGKCAEVCPTDALELVGKTMSAEEVIAEVEKDSVFYETSGGGLTVSGGEPMAQIDFTYEILRLAKERGIHTAMETSGLAPTADFERVAPLVDLFLFDIKETSPTNHEKFIGTDGSLIHKNLKLLDSLGKDIILRCPIIPGINDRAEHLAAIGELANTLSSVKEIHIEPYHPLGKGKSELLGKNYPLPEITFPEKEEVEEWVKTVQSVTKVPARRS